MKKQMKIPMRRRKLLLKEWAGDPYDWSTASTIQFSGTALPFAELTAELDLQVGLPKSP
jgi:hypothetical protein